MRANVNLDLFRTGAFGHDLFEIGEAKHLGNLLSVEAATVASHHQGPI
jgi:hypothetical protein